MSYSQSQILFSTKRRCPVRILIVTEDRIHFRETDNGFSLSELINKGLIPGAMPWEDLKITTARRFGDSDGCADIPAFKFETNTFGIDKYDQVWLFGDLGEDDPNAETPKSLSESELEVLSRFMNAGGGVFATGDHANLGYALCGKVPRVRSMRKWCFKYCASPDLKAPGVVDVTRIDTLREGLEGGFEVKDQSDSIPQEIRPKYYLDKKRKGAFPHKLLVNGDFAITVMPDHMHEGECVVPKNLGESIKFGDYVFDEYPVVPETATRLAPQIVAIATSAGGHLIGDFGAVIPPVEPRAFNVIVAYDGHEVLIQGKPVGRVVVNSSFHHFLDINLNGTGSGDPRKRGFHDSCGNPTKDYEALKMYFSNIARWLLPPDRGVDYYHGMLLDLRFKSPLIEELVPTPNPEYEDYLLAGALTERVIAERFSKADAVLCGLALMSPLSRELRLALASLLDPWLPASLDLGLANPFLDATPLARLFIGASIMQIATQLPPDPFRAGEQLDKSASPESALSQIISRGIRESAQLLPHVAKEFCNTANKLQGLFSKAGVSQFH